MDSAMKVNIFNFNASRCSNLGRIQQFYDFFEQYSPTFVCIQEINIASALKMFSSNYQVHVNMEQDTRDGIGIVTLVKNGIAIQDAIIGKNGRIIGLKVQNMQIWNVYPKSGSAFKKDREKFFRETLCNLFMNWKDATDFIFQAGDHNCIHRERDSLNNSQQHMQPGLVKHMEIHGLSDDFIKVHGQDQIMFSRITQNSSTRIDYVLSNTKECSYFQYLDMGLGLDHRSIFAKYDIELVINKEFISREKYFSGWVISKQLQTDECFLESCKFVFKEMSQELENGGRDPSFIWLKMKSAIVSIAREREKQIRREQNKKIEVLQGYYCSVLSDLQKGVDCYQEFKNIVLELNSVYEERSRIKVDKMRGKEIDDHVYDIHKVQNQRKYEDQKKINEIKIDDKVYTGTSEVVNAIEEKMKKELEAYNDKGFNAPLSRMEELFISKLGKVQLTDHEKEAIIGPITEQEISYVLDQEVDKDSSPGEDGITYRF